MTDRFDAQLRQHLLGTANERAADGQIAEILEDVAVTPQRRSFTAGLTWWPERVGRFPMATVRYGLVAAVLVALLVGVLVVASGFAPGRSTVFEGTWRSIDPGDGSRQTLIVAAGDQPAVRYEDDVATVACADDASKAFAAEGAGEISGSRLAVTYPDGGGCGSTMVNVDPAAVGTFDYDADTDTIVGPDGVTWSRARGVTVPTIPPLESAASRSTVFEGNWTATDRPDGSTMTLVVGAGATPAVRFQDDFATGAACQLDAVKVFTADGTGQVSRSRLVVAYPDGGGCGTKIVQIAGRYDYRADTDTLVDQEGLVWSRVDDGLPAATRPPRTAAPNPAAAFEALPSYTCNLRSGTYGGHFGDILVTVTTPTTWHGIEDYFHAEDEGCGGGAGVRIEVTVATAVYKDGCDWLDSAVAIGTAGWETAAFSEQSLFEVDGPAQTEVAGYPALRYDFSIPVGIDASTCRDGLLSFWRDAARPEGVGPQVQDPGSMNVYFVDVDGVTFGVYAFKGEGNSTPEMRAELDGVVESLRFEP